MAEYDRGRLGIPQVYFGEGVQDPLRGVFTEGLRQTGVDISEGITSSRQGEREWSTPIVGERGGSLDTSFGQYQMTPDSSNMVDSGHWGVTEPVQAGALGSDNKTVAPDVDATQNPAAKLAVDNARRDGVVSQDHPTQEAPKTQNQQMTEQFEQQGKQQMAQKWMQSPWNENKGMNMAMISFGLNLLSGNNWAKSFNAAGKVYQDVNGAEERKSWAEEMMARGYNPAEIQQWVATGDSKVLTDPNIAKQREQQMALGAAQLKKAEYETSDAYLQKQADKEARSEAREDKRLELSELSTRSTIQNQRDTLALNREKMNLEREAKVQAAAEKKAKADADFKEGKHKAKLYSTRLNQANTNYNKFVSENPDVYEDKGTTSAYFDAATIEGMFSGNQMLETAARRNNPKVAEQISMERAFLAPVLRVESGAAISNMEWKTGAEQFFPRPGDTPQRISEKAQMRDLTTLAMRPEASSELKEVMELYANGDVGQIKIGNDRKVYVNQDGKWYGVDLYN